MTDSNFRPSRPASPALGASASTAARASVSQPPGIAARPEVLLAIITDLSVDHRCHKWARSLREAGYEPVIYCDQPLNPLGAAWDGFDVRILTRESHQRRFFPVFFTYLIKLLPHLWRTRATVWVSLDAPPLMWLALWGKLRGRTVVYDSHELYLETPLVLNRTSRRVFWTLWERLGFALIRKAVTVSPAIRDRLQESHPHVRFHLLPNMPLLPEPLTWPEPRPPSPAEPVRLIYQGGLRAASGLPELFTALKSRPRFTLDIYGGGPEDASLREAAHAAGIADRVYFHGTVPFEALPALIAKAHAGIHLVQPTCGSFALTLSNKIFDYAQAMAPVLFSDNPSHRALLDTHRVGVTADSFSPEAVGHALDDLIDNHARYAEACRAAREEWHWGGYFRGLPGFLGLR